MTPGSCSTGIHNLLEKIEAAFEVYLVHLLTGNRLAMERPLPAHCALHPSLSCSNAGVSSVNTP